MTTEDVGVEYEPEREVGVRVDRRALCNVKRTGCL